MEIEWSLTSQCFQVNFLLQNQSHNKVFFFGFHLPELFVAVQKLDFQIKQQGKEARFMF